MSQCLKTKKQKQKRGSTMGRIIVRILAVLPGLPMLVIGLSLVLQPAVALDAINMPLLEGLALSSQLGDLTSFFLCCAAFIFMGAYHGAPRWLYAGAALIFVAAIARIYAWQVHGAGFPPEPIAVEVISTIWLVVCAVILSKPTKAKK
ncbi:MAG: hypothetical protein ACI82A_002253 [Candidatus Azotimanducaceae bacterium]|jgi:hypothetical protein